MSSMMILLDGSNNADKSRICPKNAIQRLKTAFVRFTAGHIARLRGEDEEEFARKCLENGMNLFGIAPCAPRGM